ncbi:unnamed protein product [Ectocarpus sp. 4 AP-2014]
MAAMQQKLRASLAATLTETGLLRSDGLINGKWVKAASGKLFPVNDPGTDTKVASVSAFGEADAKLAVSAAEQSFDAWRSKTMQERGRLLSRWSELIGENSNDLATIMCLESGKPKAESKGEVNYAMSFINMYAGMQTNGMVLPQQTDSHLLMVTKEPVGVCALLTPWNFPAAMFTRKAAPALMAGCTIVLKPAEDTPLTALALAWLWERAGGPKGVVNVVPTPRELVHEVGNVLTTDEAVRKISFTGSTTVGKHLLKQAAGTVKKTSMELGGNAPFVVFDDANLELAVNGAMTAKFRFGGQVCIAPNRFLVQEGIYEAFVAKMAERVRALRVGDGLDSRTNMGPLINLAARDKVAGLVKDAIDKGAEVVCGGQLELHEMGNNFFAPTLLGGCTLDMRISQEEIFGPVVAVMKFKDADEALAISNSSRSGLAGYVYTQDYSRGMRFAGKLEVGMVGINESSISSCVVPFGGVKESGMGREGSVMGMDEFMEVKSICLGGI